MIQDQTNRKDAGKPRYDLLPTEFFQSEQYDLGFTEHFMPDGSYTMFEQELGALLKFWRREADASGLGLPFSLDEINGVCAVLEFGAKKYAAHNWETQPLTYSRVYRSALAHAIKHAAGDNGGRDEETGLPHIHHFRCNVLFLWTYERRGLTELDDRPTGIVYRGMRAAEDCDCACPPECVNLGDPVKIEVGRRYKLVKPHDDCEGGALKQPFVTIVRIRPNEIPSMRYEVKFGEGQYEDGDYFIGENAVLEPV